MKQWLSKKTLLILLGILVTTAIVLTLIAKFYLTPKIHPDAIKATIQEKLQNKTGMQATIPTLQVKWWPRPTLRGQNITITDPKDRRHPIKLPTAKLSIAILPLLTGNIELHHIELIGPDISISDSLVKRLRSRPNAKVKRSSATTEQTQHQPQQKSHTTFIPDSIAVHNGTIAYLDSDKNKHQLTTLDLTVTQKGKNRYAVAISGDYSGHDRQAKAIKLSAIARWTIKSHTLDLASLSFNSKLSPASSSNTHPIDVSADRLIYQQGDKTFDIKNGQTSCLGMSITIPNLKNRKSGALTLTDGTIKIKAGNIKKSFAKLGYADANIPSSSLASTLTFKPIDKNKQQNSFEFTLGNESITLETTITPNKQKPGFLVKNATLTVNDHLTPANWLSISNAINKNQHPMIQELKTITKPIRKKITDRRGTSTFGFDIGTLNLGPLGIKGIGGTIKSHQNNTQISFKTRPSATRGLIAPLPQSDLEMTALGAASGTLTTRGSTATTMKQQLSGTININLTDGSITSDKIHQILSTLRLELKNTEESESEPNKITFKSLNAPISIKSGRADLSKIRLRGDDIDMDIKQGGSYNISNDQLSANMVIAIKERFSPALYLAQNNITGGHLPVTLRGPISDPVLTPDVGALIIKPMIDKALDRSLGGALKGLIQIGS